MLKNRKKQSFSTDGMMLNVARSLVRDFQRSLGEPEFCSDIMSALGRCDISGIRELSAAEIKTSDPVKFKAEYQIKNLLKRYRFQKDLYTDDELVTKAITGFVATQNRLAAHDDLSRLDKLTNHVLDVAAKYIAFVLGDYRDEEHRASCRFGKKATVGVPMRSACEAARWELPVSGSANQIHWFDSEMGHVDCVQDYWMNQFTQNPSGSVYNEISCLTLALVPKTFKSLRSIIPNSTIGSYQSSGLGEMIRKRLKRVGYDIRSLQAKHRIMACESSVTGKNVTVDLSAASDTISVQLVKRLLPADWYNQLAEGRIDTVVLPDGTIVRNMSTFCTMGIGYTFPLQTLIFLALLKAVKRVFHWNVSCDISVYGDDMIFDRRMYNEAEFVFEKLGFIINVDKTFIDGPFRESCGGDYFAGVDVRPFQPQNGPANVGKTSYEAVLYKTINGLLRRWSEYEIEETLGLLLSELSRVVRGSKLVPMTHPDDSGIKCQTLSGWEFLTHAAVVRPKLVGHGLYRFSFLRFRPDERLEVRHEPYLWVALRSRLTGPVNSLDYQFRDESPRHPVLDLVDLVTGVSEVEPETFHIKECDPVITFRSQLTGKRLRRTDTLLPVSGTGRYIRQSGTSWFDGRS